MKRTSLLFVFATLVASGFSARADEPTPAGRHVHDGLGYAHGPRPVDDGNDEKATIDPSAVYVPTVPGHVVERAERRNRAWNELNAKLDQPVTIALDGVTIRAAVRQVAEQVAIPLVIEEKSLEEEGISIDEEIVSLDLANVSAEAAFRQIMRRADLETFFDGEVLVVSTRAYADEQLTVHVYAIADLVVQGRGEPIEQGVESLMQTIHQSSDGPWLDIDGTGGSIASHFYGGVVALAVRQTDKNHRDIEKLLYDLRQARSPAVQQVFEDASGDAVGRVESQFLRLRNEARQGVSGLRERLGTLKIQELTPELRDKIEALRSDARSLAPSIEERLEDLRRREPGRAPTRDQVESLLERQKLLIEEKLRDLRDTAFPDEEPVPAEIRTPPSVVPPTIDVGPPTTPAVFDDGSPQPLSVEPSDLEPPDLELPESELSESPSETLPEVEPPQPE
ncbi:MAG: hypothetical protein M3552_17730 [Planctomycetota bacterium]|nr:hypothetical protein [Planctomycetaceae bacterium]MDQ3332461.1 hypothetical protein [Planctomycetota bacterium]